MNETPFKRFFSDEAVDLAAELLRSSRSVETTAEKAENKQLAAMIQDESGKNFTISLADQVFRIRKDTNAAHVFCNIIQTYGIPEYLSWTEKAALRVSYYAVQICPWLVIPAVSMMTRFQARKVILDSSHQALTTHIDNRKQAHFQLNINQLGEAVLGEQEAQQRIADVVALLENPDIDYVSIKISNLYSQIHVLAFEHTLEQICERLRILYRCAIAHGNVDSTGKKQAKFINLDMEEYRDVELTKLAFQTVLSEDEFLHLKAGIVLQAYLPDTHEIQIELTKWAQDRIAQGGAPIKIRLVKGANLAMEKVDAEIHGWTATPYSSKAEVDANFKRMVEYGSQKEHAQAVHLGIASHNLFDIAWAMLLRAENKVEAFVSFEMLEGMAAQQARIVNQKTRDLIFYAPIVSKKNFSHALAYLVRRLDENTHPQNFLYHSFNLKVGSRAWRQQEELFRDAVRERHQVSIGARRKQNRNREHRLFDLNEAFANEPDTDFILPENREWIATALEEWQVETFSPIPLVIDGSTYQSNDLASSSDPGETLAKPSSTHLQQTNKLYQFYRAEPAQVEQALKAAQKAQPSWEGLGLAKRRQILAKAAELIAQKRGQLIAAMQQDAGKNIHEADVEVSEAIDFANYYARGFDQLPAGLHTKSKGVVAVVSPWNFPFAIPIGGCMAALIGGNSVIFKPAPETVLSAWLGAEILWEAGVPKDVLQFVPAPDNHIGLSLVTDSRIAAMIFTGSSQTAALFQETRPELPIYAETSGKNMLLVTDAADTDLAAKDLISSAFGHAGQKCSACSLALLTAPVYDDANFLTQLYDAAHSLSVGPAKDSKNAVNTLIQAPQGDLKRILIDNELEKGQRWLLKPKMLEGNPRLWSPGILLGVKPEHWITKAELFGPVLALLRFEDFESALQFQNSSDFGLTGGLHSLYSKEINQWRDTIEVGNAYINRGITGAIVNRQPFGGWKKSSIGPGAKAGGRNYVYQFVELEEQSLACESAIITDAQSQFIGQTHKLISQPEQSLKAAAMSYQFWQEQEFLIEHDAANLSCESNVFRYVARETIALRCSEQIEQDLEEQQSLIRFVLAALSTQVPLEISTPKLTPLLQECAALKQVTVIQESNSTLTQRIEQGVSWDLLRSHAAVELPIQQASNQAGIAILADKVSSQGRIELLAFYQEQSISETMHRYGNPIQRS